MNITISTKDGVPIYRQIVNQIRYMVASGLLLPSEEISPVRTLALKLNVTPNTVVKAYAVVPALTYRMNNRPWQAGNGIELSRYASMLCWPKPTNWIFPQMIS